MLGPSITQMEDKYDKLSKKIFRIQNIELKNPIRSDNLEYQIDKFDVNMQRTMNDFDNKSQFLQSEMMSLRKLFESKENIRRLNMKKVSDEISLTENSLRNALKSFREEIILKIDNMVNSIEGNIDQMKQRQNNTKQQIMSSLGKLKQLTEVDMDKLKKEAKDFSNENNANITSTNQLFNNEFQCIYNQIQYAKELRESNDSKFIKDIQFNMNKIKDEITFGKAEREKFEERIFGTLTETIKRLQQCSITDN